MNTINLQLQQELDEYLDNKTEFSTYYPNMNILVSNLYKEQLKQVLKVLDHGNENSSKSFKLYLDTVIINMHSKIKKYKQSIYFTNENVKDIDNQGFMIPFYIDQKKDFYVILGLIEKKPQGNNVENSNSSI